MMKDLNRSDFNICRVYSQIDNRLVIVKPKQAMQTHREIGLCLAMYTNF